VGTAKELLDSLRGAGAALAQSLRAEGAPEALQKLVDQSIAASEELATMRLANLENNKAQNALQEATRNLNRELDTAANTVDEFRTIQTDVNVGLKAIGAAVAAFAGPKEVSVTDVVAAMLTGETFWSGLRKLQGKEVPIDDLTNSLTKLLTLTAEPEKIDAAGLQAINSALKTIKTIYEDQKLLGFHSAEFRWLGGGFITAIEKAAAALSTERKGGPFGEGTTTFGDLLEGLRIAEQKQRELAAKLAKEAEFTPLSDLTFVEKMELQNAILEGMVKQLIEANQTLKLLSQPRPPVPLSRRSTDTSSMYAGSGPITVNVNGAGNPVAVAREVERALRTGTAGRRLQTAVT
jgi:hypothetical protein